MLVTQNFIICLSGLPASGKTTFANKLKGVLEEKSNNLTVKIIDPDKIREEITPSKFNYKVEPIVREKNLNRIKKELEQGYIVISDDLNYYSSMRHDLKDLANYFHIKFFIIYISTPFKICKKWNKKRKKPIPNNVIKKIQQKFDGFDRYNWDQPFAEYDLSQIQDLNGEVECLVKELINQVNLPLESINKGNIIEITTNKGNQNLDVITRAYIGKLLRSSNFFLLEKKLSKMRKSFIKLYKNQYLNDLEITKAFKKYLEQNLNINIPSEL